MSHRYWRLLWMAPGAAFLVMAMFADLHSLTAKRALFCQIILCCAALAVLLFGFWLSRPGRRFSVKHTAFALVACLLVYVGFEIVCSATVMAMSWLAPDQLSSFWIFEDSDRTMHFDPARGAWLTQTPSRIARVTYGQLEYVGAVRGNAQGYADEDDFTIEKPASVDKRCVVFGDSFSAGQYLSRNWPDYVEDEVKDRWQLYNFSFDGGGLANWWSSYTRVVEPEHYQFDTVIFAVFGDDLHRGFSFSEHRGYQRHMFARSESWNPDDWPKSADDAKKYLHPISGSYIVHPDEFATAIETKRLARSESQPTFFQRFWLTYNTYSTCKTIGEALVSKPAPLAALTQGPQELMQDLQQRLAARNVEILVVHVPSRDELLGSDQINTSNWREEAKRFAQLLGAKFVDGALAFEGLTPQQIRDHWFPYDGHWAQAGSDCFGRFMVETLKRVD